MPLGDGDVFAGFIIQRLLGSGGMGEVYLAQHPRLPRLDALKILPAGLTDDADFRQRFNREADLAASLWHPNIVGLHDRGEFDGQLWISMDFVDGIDAARALREGGPGGMPPRDVLEIVTAVADALDYAHQRNLLHRDIKPANILLTRPDADRRRILLADFGIARRADDVSGLTATNTTVGSIAYAAPEQLMGQSLDGRADQYALATTAFHLLSGRQAFEHSNAAVVISQHLTAPPPQLAWLRADLARLDPVLTKAMAKDPAQRYPRCLDFARALGDAIVGGHQQATLGGGAFAPVEPATRAAWPAPGPPMPAWQPMPYPPIPGPHLPYPTMPAPTRRHLPAILVPLVLVLMLIGTSTFAVTQALRPEQPTAAPTWQPYVAYAKQFTVWLTSTSPRTVDADVQRVLDGSTGQFHDEFAKTAGHYKELIKQANTESTGTVASAALESISGTTAHVLVAASVTQHGGNEPSAEPRHWRVSMQVEKVGGGYRTSKVEFVP